MKNYTYFMTLVLFIFVHASVYADSQELFAKYDMRNAASPQENLITAGQPSIADLKRLAKLGTKIVVNLRTKAEFDQFDERQEVEKLGMTYVSIEVAGMEGVNEENTRLLDDALGDLKQPVFLHCASSNRVGGLLAYRAFSIQNKTTKEALAFGKSAGMSSTESRVRKLLGLSE